MSAEAELLIVQSDLAILLNLPLDTPIDDLLKALRDHRPQSLEPVREFHYVGPLPEGYEIHVVYETGLTDGEGNMQPDRARAQRMDLKWSGPWRKHGQGGLITGDAWKHVTQAKDAEVDEAGPV